MTLKYPGFIEDSWYSCYDRPIVNHVNMEVIGPNKLIIYLNGAISIKKRLFESLAISCQEEVCKYSERFVKLQRLSFLIFGLLMAGFACLPFCDDFKNIWADFFIILLFVVSWLFSKYRWALMKEMFKDLDESDKVMSAITVRGRPSTDPGNYLAITLTMRWNDET